MDFSRGYRAATLPFGYAKYHEKDGYGPEGVLVLGIWRMLFSISIEISYSIKYNKCIIIILARTPEIEQRFSKL